MEIYIVMKVAIYNHDIFGAYETKEQAVNKAKELANSENDAHHSFDVVALPMNGVRDIEMNEFSGQHCEQKTEFSITKKMDKPTSKPILWGT